MPSPSLVSMVVGISTKVGDASYTVRTLGKSPHETLCTRSNDDSQRNGKNRFYDAKSGDSTNQSDIDLESVRDRVDCDLYICKSLTGSECIKGVGKVRY